MQSLIFEVVCVVCGGVGRVFKARRKERGGMS